MKVPRSGLRAIALATAGLCLLGAVRADACSTFVIKEGEDLVFGKNFDFFTGLGMVVVNKRGVSKTGALGPEQNPPCWVSKYGSITFNQVSRELPFGGMNEAGLVIEQMWLDATEYPQPDERAAVGELQWIQYQLDNFSSVVEVVASDTLIRIRPGGATLHYLVCDREGNVATIEFVGGEMVAHTGKGLPASVLTNSTYDACLGYLKRHEGFGGDDPIPASPSSEDRFVRAAGMVDAYRADESKSHASDPVEYAFDILSAVAQGEATLWSIVYDIPAGEIHFRTPVGPHVKTVGLADFDFRCDSPVRILDIHSRAGGIVSADFSDYTTAGNRDLIRGTFEQYTKAGFFGQMPGEETIERMALYPEALPCEGGREPKTPE